MSAPDQAFGLDPSGYSTAGTALVRARRGDPIEASVLGGHPFATVRKGDAAYDAAPELAALQACLASGPVCVDAPLDLLDLPDPPDVRYVWQQTLRPVDRTFGGMPALADRIGACVARLRPLVAALGPERIGRDLFETYPAATLKRLGLPSTGYKGRAVRAREGWRPAGTGPKDARLAELLDRLGWTAEEGFELVHDAFDAALCAVTGLAEPGDLVDVEGETAADMAARYPQVVVRHARGYRLLAREPGRVHLRARPWRAVAPLSSR